MKKVFWMLSVVCMLVALAVPALAYDPNELVTARRTWALSNGSYIRQIPFPFQIPWGNGCGTLEVKEYKRSQPFFGVVGSWESKLSGENVPMGWYLFEVKNADLTICTPIVDFTSQPIARAYLDMIGGSFMEIEPEDTGLFTQGATVPNNVFGLSADDRAYSYELASIASNTMRTLDSFAQNTGYFSDTGRNIVGVIIADSRGFLKTKIMFGEQVASATTAAAPALPEDLPKGILQNPWVQKIVAALQKPQNPPVENINPEDVVVREGDIVVLIRDEQMPY